MKKRTARKYQYHATSKSMYREEDIINGYYLEFNPAIQMYRCNHPEGVPMVLMGYTSHRRALVYKVKKLGSQL